MSTGRCELNFIQVLSSTPRDRCVQKQKQKFSFVFDQISHRFRGKRCFDGVFAEGTTSPMLSEEEARVSTPVLRQGEPNRRFDQLRRITSQMWITVALGLWLHANKETTIHLSISQELARSHVVCSSWLNLYRTATIIIW